MQHQPEQQEPFDVLSRIIPRLMMFVVKSWATSVEVFLRRDFGTEYLGSQAAFVLLLIPVYIVLAPLNDPRPMLLFLIGYVAMCFGHRISGILRRWRGEHGHRYYNGAPRLWKWCPRLSEMTVKKVIEPLFVMVVGICLLPFVPPLAIFLLIGAGCSGSLSVDWDLRVKRRAREMHDAVIEQEAVAERFRDLRGDRYR